MNTPFLSYLQETDRKVFDAFHRILDERITGEYAYLTVLAGGSIIPFEDLDALSKRWREFYKEQRNRIVIDGNRQIMGFVYESWFSSGL